MARRRKKPQKTIVSEFMGASRAEQEARPEVTGLGSRYGTLWIFLFLIAGTLAFVGGGIYMYDQEINVWLGDNFDRELPWLSEDEEETEGGTTGGTSATDTDGTTGPGEDGTTTAGDTDSDTQAAEPPPSFSIGEIEVSGRITKSSVVERLDKVKPEFEKCHTETASAKALTGTLPVKISIKWNGRMSKLTAKGDGVYDKALEACFRKVVSKIKFPKPRGSGTATATIPMTLQGTASPPK